ncbi:hypothetical protein T440DRAFT_536828 [Plenodomus tracheiphilus IPT5]|uniref:Uncharacterized protein n=1 Tax=Plenodomus tracheiphilus IPT5 TaxID=1408161 RepID=A0A6A7AYA3_9PLEO|nr:hypothetical protein T440DRAFT_536828 [Plenodomus tracheiphilus IPT5]
MKPMFESNEVKGSFLTTLPDTMDNVINNLSAQGLTKYVDLEPKILDIADKHSLDTNGSLSAAFAARQSNSRQGCQNTRAMKPPPGADECT